MKHGLIQRLKIDLTLIAAAVVAGALVLSANTSFAEILDIIASIP